MPDPTDRPVGALRVLAVGTRWPSRPFVDELLVGLSSLGVSVTLATPASATKPPADIATLRTPSGDRSPFADPLALVAGLSTLARHPVSGASLWRRVRASRPASPLIDLGRCLPALRRSWDVLYMPWVGTLVSHAALVGRQIPVVVSCRGSQILIARHNPLRAHRFETMRAALRRATAVHCVSSDLGNAIESLGVPGERLRVIRTGIDTTFFTPRLPDRADRLRLITVGRLHWKKGQEYALLALRRLLDDGVPAELTIVGDGPDRSRLLFTIRDLGLDRQVSLAGALDRDAVREALRGADVFVLPSLTEGISNAALEAMACGLPLVSTTAGGMPEAIGRGNGGDLVPLRDPDAMAARLRELWLDPEKRVAMGLAARDRVESTFDRGAQLTRFLEMLSEAAGSGPPAMGTETETGTGMRA